MSTPATSRYGVKSAVFTFNSVTYPVASAPASVAGETKDPLDVTALSDTVKQFIAGPLKEVDEFTVTLFTQSTGNISVDTAPAAASIAITLNDGINVDATLTVSWNRLIVTKVSPPSIDGSGERKATYDVTFKPDGSSAT